MTNHAITKTHLLLGAAGLLLLGAVGATSTKPRSTPLQPKPVSTESVDGTVKLEARTSHGSVQAPGSEVFAELTVTLLGAAKPAERVSLALALDHSGSMAGEKLASAKNAAHRLVDLLGDSDELALVSFGSDVTATPLTRTDAEGRAALHRAVDRMEASGGTFISGALQRAGAALDQAAGARRIVLVSDGQPTLGLQGEALARHAEALHRQGNTVTALGVGADYDGVLMQHLAEVGGGMYGYLQDAATLEEVLALEVSAARLTVARNVELQLDAGDFEVLDSPGRHVERRANDTGDRAVLSLTDLRPGVPTQVLLRLRSRPRREGEAAQFAATVTWRPLEGSDQRTRVSVALPVVDSDQAFAATRDEAIFARGVSAEGQQQLVAAAQAYERGDVSTAGSLFDGAKRLFGMSADALAGQDQVERVRRDYFQASPVERKGLTRSLEKKSLSTFGKGNEGY